MVRSVRRFLGVRGDEGITIPLVALILVTLITATAFTVDLGRQMALRRDLQADADVVALDLSRLIDGRVWELYYSSYPAPATDVSTVLARSAADNDIAVANLTVRWGVYDRPTDVFTESAPGAIPTHVQVSADDSIDYFFASAIGFGTGGANRAAVAGREPKASVHVGSVAAGLAPNTPQPSANGQVDLTVYTRVLQAYLHAAFGASLPNGASADVLSYQGLGAATYNMGDLAGAAGFGSADEMAASTMTAGSFFDAASTVADQNGDSAAAAYFAGLRTNPALDQDSQLSWGNVLSASSGSGSLADLELDGVSLAYLAAQAVNGNNLLDFTFDPGIPGVTVGNVRLHVVERPQVATGRVPDPVVASTAQIRLALDINVTLPGVTAPVRVPLVIEAAQADATLTSIRCLNPLFDTTEGIHVDTSAARMRVGTTSDLAVPAGQSVVVQAATTIQAGSVTITSALYLPILAAGLLGQNIAATGDLSVGGGSEDLTFFPYDPPNPWQRTVGGGGTDVGAALSGGSGAFLTTVAGPLGVDINTTLISELDFVFEDIGAQVLNPLLRLGGVTFGGADVRGTMEPDHVAACGRPLLVD